MAMLILLMVSAVVAAGIPAAVRSYNKVVDKSNAQVMLSTTMTVLRDELKSATEVETDDANSMISYFNSADLYYTIFKELQETDENSGIIKNQIMIDEYAYGSGSGNAYEHALVSTAAGGKTLYVTYESVEFASDKGVVTFNGLAVYKINGDHPLADVPEYKIRVYPES